MIWVVQFIVGYIILGWIWVFTYPADYPGGLIQKIFAKDTTGTTRLLILVLIPQIVSGLYFPWPHTQFNLVFNVAGSLIYWMGFGLAAWAKFTMNNNWGTPAQHNIKTQSVLVTNGPFRFTRNPIYLGLCFVAIGASIGLQSIFAPLVILFILHVRRMAMAEEKLLERHFGQSYNVYKKRIPRFL